MTSENFIRVIGVAALMTLVASIGFSGGSSARAAGQSGRSILANGNFSTPDKSGGWPKGWGKGPGISWKTGKNGKHFMRLMSQTPPKIVMLYRSVALPAGCKGIRIQIRYRTKGVKRGAQDWNYAQAICHYLDGNSDQVHPGPAVIHFAKQTKGWTDVTEKAVVPGGVTALQIMPGLWRTKAGTLDLAEVRVTALRRPVATAMAAAAALAAKKMARRHAIVKQELTLPAATPELYVVGNRLVTAGGKHLWLQGVCVDSLQWSPTGEHVLWSIHVAIKHWKARLIRLPVLNSYWFGQGPGQTAGTQEQYRRLVDKAIRLVAGQGDYLIIDLHRFGHPVPADIKFWRSVASRYKNNPAVIFELFNEPHSIGWNIWRNGGNLKKTGTKHADHAAVENNIWAGGEVAVGLQTLVDTVRATGAENILLAGGLAWSYDLRGILHGYALKDAAGGRGIAYVWHVYPWKDHWAASGVFAVAAKYPVFVTEVGCPLNWSSFTWVKPAWRFAKLGPKSTWPRDILGAIQHYHLNWTGFSFNPNCGPPLVKNWHYAPTLWGRYVKAALAGKHFEHWKMR